MQRYIRLLSGADLPVVAASQAPPAGVRILLGGPDSNELVAAAQQKKLVNFTGLKQDGFVLQQIELDDAPALVVGGNDDASTMYAAYDLFERLGVVFQITEDIIPERKPDLVLSDLHVRMEPALKYRGLHVRHFVLPWMGIEDFRKLLDQHAKMKCNYFEFYWYVGAPWTEYSYNGEKGLIGDVYTKESGYTTWQVNTATFTSSDVKIGRDHFSRKRVCAPEFQDCETQAEAHRAARQLLKQIIDYAHQRKIQVRLGMGDCPSVPPNLGRLTKYNLPNTLFGTIVSPGDPAGVEIWVAAVKSMIDTYPEADGYWVWLAECYFHFQDPGAKKIVTEYEDYRKLIPSLEELRKLGYDQYFEGMSEQRSSSRTSDCCTAESKSPPGSNSNTPKPTWAFPFWAERTSSRHGHPVPKEIPFQSMEASICWNRGGRVPMQLFANARDRETFLVPRLDDDRANSACIQLRAIRSRPGD